MQLLLTDIGIN
jgi:hypothetical protein